MMPVLTSEEAGIAEAGIGIKGLEMVSDEAISKVSRYSPIDLTFSHFRRWITIEHSLLEKYGVHLDLRSKLRVPS